MSPTPVLDTNFLIRLDAGDESALRALRLIQDEPLIVPAQVAAEYLVRSTDRPADLARLRAAFSLRHTTDEHLLVVARLAAHAFDALHAERPRWGDLQVAAAGRLENTFVVTTNKRHFKRLDVPAWHYVDEARPPTTDR